MKKIIKKEILIKNKNFYKYNIKYEIICGISLLGWEIKSIRNKKINIDNSYISIINKEFYLIESIFTPLLYCIEKKTSYVKNRYKKLLLKKKDILNLYGKIKKKLIKLIVISIFLKNNVIAKLKIGICNYKNYKKYKSINKNNNYKINKNLLKCW